VGAAESLGHAGASNGAVMSALLEVLHSANVWVRERTEEILDQVGASNEAVVSVLLKALRDANRNVQMKSVEILGRAEASNEAVVSALLEVLHSADRHMRMRAAESLGQVGASNGAVVSALLGALRDADEYVRVIAATSLGRLEIKDTIQLRKVLVALNRCLYDWDNYMRQAALGSIRQLLDGQPIPGYQWVPLRKRQARLRSLKRIAILAGVVAFFLIGALTFALLDPNSLIAHWVISLSILASIVSLIGVTLRDLWKRKQSNRVEVPDGD